MLPDYHDLIIQWFNRSFEEKELFTKFIFLYISFNAFVNQTREGWRERQKIQFLKTDPDAKHFYIKLLEKDKTLAQVMSDLIKELNDEPIQNSTEGRIYWIEEDGKLRNEADWENLVEYWYRVRNNLFHGHKVPNFPRDKKLVTYAYLTLFPLMKNFVDHYLAWDFD